MISLTLLRASAACLTLIRKWEGIEDGDPSTVNLDPYLCPAGLWTIGYGHVVLDPDAHQPIRDTPAAHAFRQRAYSVYPGGITREEALTLLRDDLRPREAAVARRIGDAETSQAEFDAMVSLCFNIGAANFGTSSVVTLHCAGDKAEAADAFLRWDKLRDPRTGVLVESGGLRNRRADERYLYLSKEG